ncbi:Uncharacterised protein [Bordetella pertussis]|nr:Uncharacterised protein [Bordetella pertussis]CPM22655.1 Uncharacterised protein [Bordetella pertussis]
MGNTRCCAASQISSVMLTYPCTGSQPSQTENMSINRYPTTKLGSEKPMTA